MGWCFLYLWLDLRFDGLCSKTYRAFGDKAKGLLQVSNPRVWHFYLVESVQRSIIFEGRLLIGRSIVTAEMWIFNPTVDPLNGDGNWEECRVMWAYCWTGNVCMHPAGSLSSAKLHTWRIINSRTSTHRGAPGNEEPSSPAKLAADKHHLHEVYASFFLFCTHVEDKW